MTETWSQWQVLVVCGVAGFLFLLELAYSVVLVAVSSMSRVALHRLAGEEEGRLGYVSAMRDFPSRYRMATAMARQLALLGGALLVGLAAGGMGLPYSGVVGTVVAAVLGVIFLETLLARLIALWDLKSAVRHTAFLIRPAYIALLLVVRPLHWLLLHVDTIQAQTDEEREEEMEEEVEAYIEVGEREGILEAEESEMMRSIVDLDETRVREIMTPRTDIVALSIDTTVAAARQAVLQAGHSRLPVYRDSVDNVIGVLHVLDLLRAWEEGRPEQPIAKYLREPMFVPEPLSVADLLSEMRVKTHMAIVVDEYGGVAGLVTLEDLLEEIVGDIRDEHDLEETMIRQESEDSWLINAATHVDELEDLFGVDFDGRDYDTVGGLVVSELGRVPAEGETLDTRSLRITVLKADKRRIRQVRVCPMGDPRESKAEA